MHSPRPQKSLWSAAAAQEEGLKRKLDREAKAHAERTRTRVRRRSVAAAANAAAAPHAGGGLQMIQTLSRTATARLAEIAEAPVDIGTEKHSATAAATAAAATAATTAAAAVKTSLAWTLPPVVIVLASVSLSLVCTILVLSPSFSSALALLAQKRGVEGRGAAASASWHAVSAASTLQSAQAAGVIECAVDDASIARLLQVSFNTTVVGAVLVDPSNASRFCASDPTL